MYISSNLGAILRQFKTDFCMANCDDFSCDLSEEESRARDLALIEILRNPSGVIEFWVASKYSVDIYSLPMKAVYLRSYAGGTELFTLDAAPGVDNYITTFDNKTLVSVVVKQDGSVRKLF